MNIIPFHHSTIISLSVNFTMKIFQCVIFVLCIVSALCEEKDKRSTSDEFNTLSLNQGEFVPFDEGYNEFDALLKYQNDHKHSTQPPVKQYIIIKHKTEYPIAKKLLSLLTSKLKQVTDATSDGKVMPVKVVKEGPVKHVYLPGLYTNQPTQIKSSKTPKLYENYFQNEYHDIYPELQQNYFKPSTEFSYSPATFSTSNQELYGHDLHSDLSGFRVGKLNAANFVSEYKPQFLTKYSNPYAAKFYSSEAQYVPQTFNTPIHSSYDIPSSSSYSYGASSTKPLYSDKPLTSSSYAANFYSTGTHYVPETFNTPTHLSNSYSSTKPLYSDKALTSSSSHTTSLSKPLSSDISWNNPISFDTSSIKSLSFDKPIISSSSFSKSSIKPSTFDTTSTKHSYLDVTANNPSFDVSSSNPVKYQQEYSYGQYPQLSVDNKLKSAYKSSDYYTRYTSTADFDNSETTKFKPSEQFTPIIKKQDSKATKLSNVDPELASLVNEVLNKGKGSPTHDGFTMIKSKTDNAIYLIGKPGMSLSTIPDFSAYNFGSFQKSEEPLKKKEDTSAT